MPVRKSRITRTEKLNINTRAWKRLKFAKIGQEGIRNSAILEKSDVTN